MVSDGPINAVAFQAYVDQVLVPTLQPGDVAMDDLSGHKGAGIRAAIEAAGADLLYLPPHSPDFNLIENAFSKLRLHLDEDTQAPEGCDFRSCRSPLARDQTRE